MKNWYQSRTVIVGLLEVIGGLLMSVSAYLAGDLVSETFWSGVALSVLGVKDVLLRFKTSESLT